jgi:hypothetical protein
MRRLLLLVCVVPICSCTTFRPVGAEDGDLQRRILTEGFLESGDKVRLSTKDGEVHEFRVSEIDREHRLLTGDKEVVLVDEIESLERRELGWGKTGALIGVGALSLLILTADCEDDCGDSPYSGAGFFCCS